MTQRWPLPPRDHPREPELERDGNDEAYSKMLHERLAALEMMWTMATDPTSGRPYWWYNAAEQTTWDDPALDKT